MKNFIKKHKTILIICLLLIMTIYWIDSAKTAEKERIAREEIQKELAEEKYQKELIEELYNKRETLLSDNEKIEETIQNLLNTKEDKLKEVEKTEHIIRCEKDNTFKENTDDCLANWTHYPLKK